MIPAAQRARDRILWILILTVPIAGMVTGWVMSATPFYRTRIHCAPHEHQVDLEYVTDIPAPMPRPRPSTINKGE